MEIKSKIWIEEDGELVFGMGRAAILNAVKETGSLNKAADKLDISYRKAWSHIQAIEKRLGKELLKKSKGGKGGGGARLTEFAEELLERFSQLEKSEQEFSNKSYKQFFEGM